jgi:hypothetical protein
MGSVFVGNRFLFVQLLAVLTGGKIKKYNSENRSNLNNSK